MSAALPTADFEREGAETAAILREIPGGIAVLTFFGGGASFHDAEIVSLTLDRGVVGRLVLDITDGERWATVAFSLHQWIDVDLKGFSRQNVINRLAIRRAGERQAEGWEFGVGVEPGDFEIVLEPCYGAYGSIQAGIAKIEFLGGR